MAADPGRASRADEPPTTDMVVPPLDAASCVLHLSAEQARDPLGLIPRWLGRIRAAGTRHVVIDMSDVNRLNLTGFGVLLAKLRDQLDMTVLLTGIGVSEAVSLRSMGLLDGVAVERRRPRGRHPAASPRGGGSGRSDAR